MENIPLGPAPAPSPEVRAGLTRRTAELLETLEQLAGPCSLADLADATGLHVNSVREHLAQLLEHGLVSRESAAPAGRGRPAWLYRAAGRTDQVTEYAGLAAALAAALHRTSPTPVEDAVVAGTEWGHDLARRVGPPAAEPRDDTDTAARRQVTAVLDRMGFDPQPEQDQPDEPHASAYSTLRLTRCPLLEAARRHPDVVCGVHLGIARGALAEYGADDSGVRLLPFAEPGACLLHLAQEHDSREGAAR